MPNIKKGFVKFDREITDWRWYKDINTFKVFFHLILTANYEDRDFEKIQIHRGQRVASYESLATETGLSVRNVRTAIAHLKSTGEITVKNCNKFSVITVCKYGDYQDTGRKPSKEKSSNAVPVAPKSPSGVVFI